MATGGGEERNALTILWRIENLSYFHKEFHGNYILSPISYPHTLEDKWTRLSLYPRGETANDENVCLFLYIDSPLPVDGEFSFLTCDGSPLVTRKGIRETVIGWVWKFEFKMTDCLTQEELFVIKKSTFLPNDTLTIRCRLWKSEGNFPNTEFISVRSRIEFAEKSILWPIGGLNLNKRETFPCSLELIHGNVYFNVCGFLNRDSQQTPELNIKVTADKIPEQLLAKLEVSVLGNGQKVIKLEGNKYSFSKSEIKQTWVIPKFVLREILREKISLLQCGKNISLLFHLTAVYKDILDYRGKENIVTSHMEHDSARTTSTLSDASCQTSEQNGDTPVHLRKVSTFSEASCQTSELSFIIPEDLQQRNNCLDILGEDFFSLYQKQEFSDFELRSGDVCFPVHKVVLSSRSPVFHSMFSSDMEESNSKSLDVPDLDAHTLNRMLTFLYGGSVEPDLPLQSAANLYYAGDKYQVDSLKNMCSSILQSQICVTNVSDILTLADRHQDSDLTSFTHNFILSRFDDVMDSKEWEKFLDMNSALAGKSTLRLYKERKRFQKNNQ